MGAGVLWRWASLLAREGPDLGFAFEVNDDDEE
jgi:hypothetical protein